MEKDMFKKHNQENVEKVIEEVTKSDLIPFLKREKSITDLESLFERIGNLKHQIDKSNKFIKELEYKIEKLESGITFIDIDTKAYSSVSVCVNPSDYSIIVENFRLSLIISCKDKIERERDLIHTCQDELDWLQMKIGMGPGVGKNMFETGSFNFDPHKDHC